MKTNCIVCNKEVENWDIAYPEDKPQSLVDMIRTNGKKLYANTKYTRGTYTNEGDVYEMTRKVAI